MADTANESQTTETTATAAAAAAANAKTVLDDMPSRRIFDNTDDAANYIAKCQTDFADFGEHPVITVGFTEDGDFDPATYDESMNVAVVKLTVRGEGSGKDYQGSVVKAIIIYPSPKIEAILNNDAALAWLTGIMEKELNHVAVRGIRKAGEGDNSTIAEAAEAMPKSIADYITSGREAGSGVLETYNELWRVIKTALASKYKVWSIVNFSKKELRKAMESSPYASQVYPGLELRENKKTGERQSLIEIAINLGKLLAKEQGLDPAFFETAQANRAERTLTIDDDEDEEIDLESWAAEVTADQATDEAATDETAKDETTAAE